MALTFGDHIIDIESKNFGSLSFLFRQILVRTILPYQNKPWIYCCRLKNNLKKKLLCNHLQYTNSVGKKYEGKKWNMFCKKVLK